ncbi:MAG: hypothetical protein AAB477_02115 [Patescibacteria group bacterium]
MKFIFSILLLIISGILFFTIVDPLYGDVSKLRTEVATYNIALDNSTDLQKTRDQLVDNYKNINKDDKERLDHFLPNTVNNIKFILEIERIANSHSMPVKNIRFEPQKTSDVKTTANGNTTVITSSDPSASLPYGSFPIEFTTEGDYNTFVLFLKDIERNLRLVDVKSINFTVPQLDKTTLGIDPNNYTYNLKVETYWLK